MALREFVLIACIGQIDGRLIKLFSRKRSLTDQLLPAIEDLLLRIEGLLRSLGVELSFLYFLRKIGCGGCGVCGFGLVICALIFLRGGGEVAVFENRQQLSLSHMTAAIHQKFLHRRADLRHDRRLRDREQDCIRRDLLLQRGLLHLHDLDRYSGFGFFGIPRAPGQNGKYRGKSSDQNSPPQFESFVFDWLFHSAKSRNQNLPVNVCRLATAVRYRTCPSPRAFCAWVRVFCESTTSFLMDTMMMRGVRICSVARAFELT